jgi:hypothetical protein
MYLQRFEDTCSIHVLMEDTFKINQDTCGINVSAVVRGYIRDTCGILLRYIMRYMYLKCILRGTYLRCRIHAGYMRDTSIWKGNQDTCGIHPRYMMRYMYLKLVDRYPGIEILVLGDLHQISQYWGITVLGDYNSGGSDTWGFGAARWRAFWGI